MLSTMKWLLPLLLSVSAFATTRTAATCNNTDVQAAINASVDGDTVNVPIGSCTWTASVTVSSGISIIGAGSGSTTILDNIFQNNMFKVTLGSASQVLRVSGMSLLPSPSLNSGSAIGPGNGAIATITGTCNGSTCSQIRFDHLAINGWLYGTGGTQNFGGFLMTVNNVFGVLDHLNVAFTTQGEFVAIGQGSYGGVGSNGDNSWTQADSYGTGNALYIEASTFTDVAGTGMAITDTDFGGGGRLVVRFNTLTNASVQTHGTESTGRQRGVRQVEVYNNALTCTNNSAGCDFVGLRSGTIHFFNNSITLSGGGFSNNGVSLSNYRDSTVFSPWGVCNGSGSYDHNDGTVYASGTITSLTEGPPLVLTDNTKSWTTNQWVQSGDPYGIADTTNGNGCQITGNTATTATCDNAFWSGPPTMTVGHSYQILRASACNDFTGRGAGTLLSGTTPSPTGWTNEVIDPAYVWGNTGSTPNFGWINSRTQEVIANRDYYNQNPSFTGTTGTGTGVLAIRPATCTTGVAYWATDQGSWNTSGSGGQGVLYTCTATNTWTSTYTPYTYPHPLTGTLPVGPPDLGEDCTNGCGQPRTGNIIITTSIQCLLHDSAGINNNIPCQSATKLYGQDALPLTIDGTQADVYWTNSVPASCGIVLGALANNSDRDQWQYDSPGVFHIGTSCHVTIKGLVPASANGNGAQGPTTFYLVSNPDATTSDPKGRFAPHVNSWPGPQCYNGSTDCYLSYAPPNPTGQLPLQWNGTPAGVVRAIRGHQAEIPLNILWIGGNATNIAWFNTNEPCNTSRLNFLAHVYAWSSAGGWSAPNSGTWYVCKNVSGNFTWVSNGSSLPAFVATSVTATAGGNTYTCPGSVNGGEDPTATSGGVHTYPPADICTGTAGSLGASITPFYPGNWVNGSAATDYRPIHYNAGLGKYWMDTNAASPPLNAQPTGLLQYYPTSTALTGDVTVQACFDTYTDATLQQKAAGTSNFCISYTINVTDETPQAQSDPASYPADTNEPAYHNNLASQAIYMCNSTSPYALKYYNDVIDYYMWLTMSPGDWGQFQTANYDNSRVFSQASDFLLAKMDGTAWPAWASGTAYGSAYALMEVTDTNGHVWIATVSGGVSGGSITWPTSPTPGQTKTDNTQTWRYVGDAAFWRTCANNAAMPYVNQVIQQGPAAWAMFPGGIFKLKERTGDAVLKGTTTYSNVLSTAVKNESFAGGFGAGTFSQFAASAGRPPAYQLMSLAVYAKTVCEQGNCAAFFGNAELVAMARWDQNAIINYSDIHIGSDPISTDYTRTYWPTFDPLHIGVGQMALREWMIRMTELGHPELIDPRIIPEVKRILDFAWTHWYNQLRVQGEGTDNWSMSYNPMDFQTSAILEPYYTELTGTIQASYDWIWRYCGGDTTNCKLSDGTTYGVAGNTIRRHQYDGRDCSNPQGKWYCQSYGIPYAGCTGAPKPFGQCDRETTGNSLQYNYGFWTPLEDDQSPQHNPCWSGGSVPCSTPTPYPDTQAPYGVQLLTTGQDDPTCEGHMTGQDCSPVQTVTSTSAVLQMNFYEQLASLVWHYGTDQTCSTGTVTFSGTPTLVNNQNQLYLYLTPLSGLQPNTQYYAYYVATDFAGNVGQNSCTAIPGGFRGGKINWTTLNQTVLTVLTTSLPNGQQGTAYTATLQAAGGVPPYTWSVVVGSLPTGLGLNASTGVISGTPTGSGTSSFTVQVTDSTSTNATQPLSINITNLTITTSSLPAGTNGTPYSATLTGTGGVTPYTWSLALGNMPPGLSLNASTGVISGTPTACGTFPDIWKLTDASTPPVFVTKPLTITVSGCSSALTITTASLPDGIQGTAYSTTLHGTGGTGSGYAWSVIVGTLPDGLALAASTGVISGTPTTPGTSSFTIQLRDSGGNSATAPLSITITDSLSITTSTLPDGTFNVAYTATLAASGGVPPYVWAINNGALPTGLSLNTSTGAITGTPTVCGTFNILWQVTDAVPLDVTKPIPITVNGCISNPVVVTTTSLPNGVVNQFYPSQTLAATGGTPPYTWSITVGALPTGLVLSTDGIISGTPTVTGIFNFTVKATDTLTAFGTAPLGINVISPAQFGVTVNGAVTATGSVSIGSPNTAPPAGSPVGP